MSQTSEQEDLTWAQVVVLSVAAIGCAVVLTLVGFALGAWSMAG